MKRKYLYLLEALLIVFTLTGAAIPSARSALTITSRDHDAQLEMYHIGITLNENEKPLAFRNYKNEKWNVNGDVELLSGITSFHYGETYEEKLSVTNSGSIDEYVRVTVYKYWLDGNGKKDRNLDPSYIDLILLKDNGWIVDESASTEERTVLYYQKPLAPGETTPDLSSSLLINGDIKKYVRESETKTEDGYTVVTSVYSYNGRHFALEVEADGVQTHNAEDAVRSAWGVSVTVKDGILSLKK